MSKPPFASMSVAILVVATPAHAQELLRTHLDGYGIAAAVLTDLDGDGVPDYAVSNLASGEGVEVISGKSGARIRLIPSPAPAGEVWEFGYAIADAGDVDGDGVHDLLIGALLAHDPAYTHVEAGGAFVYSGRDGSLLWSAYGSSDHEWFGARVSGLDDVDADGHADFLVNSTPPPTVANSFVTAYSGATGTPLYVVSDTDWPARISDRDGDGVRDFVSLWSNAEVRSGATGALIASIPTTLGFIGGIAELDDLDGDGEPEIALGEWGTVNQDDGQVRVVSVPTLTTLRTHPCVDAHEMLGEFIDSGFDADGDGWRDYLVSARGAYTPPGSASIFSGRTGERLYRFVDPGAPYFMGDSIAALGDLDGDGFGECLVGSPFHQPPAKNKTGADFVFRGNDLWADAYPKSVASGTTESVAIHGAPNGNPVALFVVDVNGTSIFHLVGLGVADPVEAFTVSGTVPTGLSGREWTLRAYALDGNGKLIVSADESIAFQ